MGNRVHKEKSPLGDTIIFMNGVPLYKIWPTGRSMLFEKYGPNTTDVDRDRGHYGGRVDQRKQKDRQHV
jgi:hypothetical protein